MAFRQMTDGEWTAVAARFGQPVDLVKKQLGAVASAGGAAAAAGQGTFTVTPNAQDTSCKDIDFDIKIFRVKGKACFTPGSNWSLSIDLTLYLAGIEISHVVYTFSPTNTSVCYHYDVLIGSLDVCFGVRSSHICLFTSGKACAFGACVSWDENLVCFA